MVDYHGPDSASALNNFHAFGRPEETGGSPNSPYQEIKDRRPGTEAEGRAGRTESRHMQSTPLMPLPVLSSGKKDGITSSEIERRYRRQERGGGHGHERIRQIDDGFENAPDREIAKHGEDYNYVYDPSSDAIRRQTQQQQNQHYQHPDFREGQGFLYTPKIGCRKEMPYELANGDSWVTRVFLAMGIVYTKRIESEASLALSKKSPRRKTKLKMRPKSKSELKAKPKSTKMKQRPSSDESKQMSTVKPKTKGKPKSKTKSCRKAKKQRELMDPDSAQYKLMHSDRSKLRRISRAELSKHILPSLAHINKVRLNEKPDGIWMMIHGYVFDIVNLLEHHPGGAECLLDCAGVDATRVFDDVGHSDIAWEMLENCCVGIMEDLEDSESGEDAEEEEADSDEHNEEHNNNNDSEDSDTMNTTVNDSGNDEREEKRKKEKKRGKQGRGPGAGDVETNNGTVGTLLVWNYKVLEYFAIIVCALFGLFCFIVLQHKKWETWEGSEAYS